MHAILPQRCKKHLPHILKLKRELSIQCQQTFDPIPGFGKGAEKYATEKVKSTSKIHTCKYHVNIIDEICLIFIFLNVDR